ncbi:hypothetical protein EGT09_02260 [Pseudomonas putida]|uniref:hypothetical protein n=1 Tax=Pseudomonas putida TaxID=303 RepID=UPI000F7680BF|nr:hypothetical protein [Pseudomonas putida]RSC25290.1 hypothetical protein EGT09_02260 [Pseudomonas putida]
MRKVGAALLILLAGMTSGCLKKELTTEEKAVVTALHTELANTQADLSQAKAKDASLSGGLVKALVAVRVEILETNAALLQQRINALESGGPVEQVTRVSAVDPELAKKLESEISSVRQDLIEAQTDALAHGGLVGAMKAAAVATKEQTLAMLQQRYLVAKYGLAPVAPKLAIASQAGADSATSQAQTTPRPSPEIPPGNGPFGLEAGLSKDLIEKMTGQTLVLGDEAQSLYMIDAPPKPNDSFQHYALVISPSVGLCQIRAIGKTITTNNYGHQMRDAFNGLQESLTSVYGKPKVLDVLMPGSIWKDSRDWMTALRKKDRTLIAEWGTSSSAPLKGGVQRINMVARAESDEKGYLMLQYSFANQKTCSDEEEQRSIGSL